MQYTRFRASSCLVVLWAFSGQNTISLGTEFDSEGILFSSYCQACVPFSSGLWCTINTVCDLWTLLCTTMAVTLLCCRCELQWLGATQGCSAAHHWGWFWCCGTVPVHPRVPAKRQRQPHLSSKQAVVWDRACLQSWVLSSQSIMVAAMCMGLLYVTKSAWYDDICTLACCNIGRKWWHSWSIKLCTSKITHDKEDIV